MKNKDEYKVVAFPKTRQPLLDALRQARSMSVSHIITDVDITSARQRINEFNREIGEPLSLTAFLTSCLAKAVDEDKSIQAHRKGNKLIVYDEVDIAVVIERKLIGDRAPFFPYIVRASNRKTPKEIHDEIRSAQRDEVYSSVSVRLIRWYYRLPAFIGSIVWRSLLGSKRWRKKLIGTVAISSIGMFVKGPGWGIPTPIHTLNITTGGIAEKPGLVEGQIVMREYLSLTISFDHNVVDGAPAARFTQRFKDLIESGYGLSDQNP